MPGIFYLFLLHPHIDYARCYIHSSADFDKASDHRPLVLKINPEPIVRKK